jgi:DNA-binding SARP family transcriptional activator
MNVCVFGETRIIDGERVIRARDLGGVKPRLLLEYLAVNVGQPVSKARLVDVLWPAGAPSGAIATMETYVSLLRRVLEPGTPARASVVRTLNGGYCLDAGRVSVDLNEFTHLIASARGLDAAARGEQVREQFAHDLTSAWTLAADCSVERGDYPMAIGMARRAVESDPYAEEAARYLIIALWRTGRRGEALRAYDRLRTTLVDDLGVEPSTETRDLHLAILLEDEVGPTADPADEDSLVLELVRLVRLMVREHGVAETRDMVSSLAARAA